MSAAVSSAAIRPDRSGHILVEFKQPMAGMRDLLIRVRSNDPIEPEQTLTLRFEVVMP